MFKNILLPTDGSRLSQKAVKEAIELARDSKASMASHGRSGLAGVLLGSETHKVLTHSEIPVLVLR